MSFKHNTIIVSFGICSKCNLTTNSYPIEELEEIYPSLKCPTCNSTMRIGRESKTLKVYKRDNLQRDLRKLGGNQHIDVIFPNNVIYSIYPNYVKELVKIKFIVGLKVDYGHGYDDDNYFTSMKDVISYLEEKGIYSKLVLKSE